MALSPFSFYESRLFRPCVLYCYSTTYGEDCLRITICAEKIHREFTINISAINMMETVSKRNSRGIPDLSSKNAPYFFHF